MCGIAGFWNFQADSSKEKLINIVTNMVTDLIHRGPDGQAYWVDEKYGVALGHSRLAIIDLSDSGKQPMHSVSGRYVIIYNGEIYNFKEIRAELNKKNTNIKWQGHSDTEVLIMAFEEWGIVKTLEKIVGMFAIVLWDKKYEQLILIRDRLGEKPLYYAWIDNYLLFASELKAFRQHFAWHPTINKEAIALQLKYNCIPAPFAIYNNTFKLQPGHFIIIKKDKSFSDQIYWSLDKVISNNSEINVDINHININSEQQVIQQLENILSRSVKQQMIADVPLGAFLSGGIDSSLIVSLMQANNINKTKTFTIGFEQQGYNEAVHAKAVANHLGTEHTELYLSPKEVQNVINSLPVIYDEPFSDSSQIPTYIVSKLTKSKVKVSLSGDGGDELFGGYNRYLHYKWIPLAWDIMHKLPTTARLAFTRLLTKISPHIWNKLLFFIKYNNPGDKIHKLAEIINYDSKDNIYKNLISHNYNHDQIVLNSQNYQKNDELVHNNLQLLSNKSFIEAMMFADTKQYLPDDILVKVDRAAMAVSLETRVPFLDHRIVEFAWQLPLHMKIRQRQGKWILRQLLYKYIPRKLIDRPKMGFGIPLATWLREDLKDWAAPLLSEDMLQKHSLLNNKLIIKIWQEHLSGKNNWQYHLWDILMFQAWYQQYHG